MPVINNELSNVEIESENSQKKTFPKNASTIEFDNDIIIRSPLYTVKLNNINNIIGINDKGVPISVPTTLLELYELVKTFFFKVIVSNEQVLNNSSTGILLGGGITISTDPTKFNVDAGEGRIIDNTTDPNDPTLKEIKWDEFNDETLPEIASSTVTFIAIDSSGTLIKQTQEFTLDQYRTHIILGIIGHIDNLSITSIKNLPVPIINPLLTTVDLFKSLGSINVLGNKFTFQGGNLKLVKSIGEQFRIGSNYNSDKKIPNNTVQPSLSPVEFIPAYRNGSGSITVQTPTSDINPNFWDDGTGILQEVENNKFTVQRVFHFSSNIVIILYGQNVYDSMDDALNGIFLDPFEIPEPSGSINRAAIALKKRVIDLTADTKESRIVEGDKLGGFSGGGSNTFVGVIKTRLINETFESGDIIVNNWTVANGVQANKWEIGIATSQSGIYSAYISDDSGITNNYNTGQASIVHFYKDLIFPIDAEDCYLSFWFKGEGETNLDFMNIYLIDSAITPTAGVSLNATPYKLTAIEFEDGEFNLQSTWKFIKIRIDPQIIAGQTKRLVFSWENDAANGANPPVAIDNIELTYQK